MASLYESLWLIILSVSFLLAMRTQNDLNESRVVTLRP